MHDHCLIKLVHKFIRREAQAMMVNRVRVITILDQIQAWSSAQEDQTGAAKKTIDLKVFDRYMGIKEFDSEN